MIVVPLNCDRITDWESFHSFFAEVFGFPDFYGRNMDAWIDCMSYLDESESGMSTINIRTGEVLTLQLDGVDGFAVRCPEQYAALVEGITIVNLRRSSKGEEAVLALSFYKHSSS